MGQLGCRDQGQFHHHAGQAAVAQVPLATQQQVQHPGPAKQFLRSTSRERFLLETFSLVILVLGARSVNVAITVWSALVVTVHESVPVHPPDQPANFEPWARVSLSPTVVPAG